MRFHFFLHAFFPDRCERGTLSRRGAKASLLCHRPFNLLLFMFRIAASYFTSRKRIIRRLTFRAEGNDNNNDKNMRTWR